MIVVLLFKQANQPCPDKGEKLYDNTKTKKTRNAAGFLLQPACEKSVIQTGSFQVRDHENTPLIICVEIPK